MRVGALLIAMSMCSIWKTNMTPPPTLHTPQSSREPERAADQGPTQPDVGPIRAVECSKTVATYQLVSKEQRIQCKD